jgi:hypothetical protein
MKCVLPKRQSPKGEEGVGADEGEAEGQEEGGGEVDNDDQQGDGGEGGKS